MKTFVQRMVGVTPDGIKALREGLDMSQDRFGQILGVNMRTVLRWEQGKTQPNDWQSGLLMAFSRARDRDERVGKRIIGYMLEQGVPFALYKILSVAYYD